MEQWQEFLVQMRKDGMSWSKVTQELHYMFPGLTVKQVENKLRGFMRKTEKYKADHEIKRPVGVIGDVHLPFAHPNYRPFLIDTFKKHKVDQVVCIGDLVDNHAISRFQSEPSARGAYDELAEARRMVAEYVKAFPKVKMCLGNHDAIHARQAATIGLGEEYLKPYHELWGLPKSWEIADEFVIDSVLYKHGIGHAGKDAAINAALQEGMSTVIGHLHSNAGAKYSANKRDLIFGLSVGCGIDVERYAFAYGKHTPKRPILGYGIVFDKGNAIFEPMTDKYFRN